MVDHVEELSFVEQSYDKKLEEDKDDNSLLMELQKLDLDDIVKRKQ
jgi:hypothetical protein